MLRSMILHHGGFPIRKSVGRSLFAAHHSLSQLVTSFFGSWCQGIHLTLLFAWTSCIMYLTILWFSLNCLSFFELLRSGLLTLVRMKRLLFAFCTCFELFHLTVKLYFPFSFGKTNISLKIICPLLFVFYSKIFSSIRLSKICLHSLCECWSVWMDSNHRPRAYQARALATWATNRKFHS